MVDRPGLIHRGSGRLGAFRVEIWIAVALMAAKAAVSLVGGPGLGMLALLVGVVATFALPSTRARWTRLLCGARRKRRWEAALHLVLPLRPPRLLSTEALGHGERAVVQVQPGGTVDELARYSETLAAAFGVAQVRVIRHAEHANLAEMTALRADPLGRPAPPWPWFGRHRTSLWEPIPVGVDEHGAQVGVMLPEHSLLLGGEPGGGKSAALSLLVAAAALDPSTTVWLLDPKLVELSVWRDCAAGFAGIDIGEATAVLRQVRVVMDARYTELLAAKRRKVSTGDPLHVVVIDELAHYLTASDKKARDVFADALRDLVSRGRAAGVIVIAATQKPGSDVVPTSLRDLFGYRWAMRCTTAAASDTILGQGWAAQGHSAAQIDPGLRGLGLLLHESGMPRRIRSHYLDDQAVANLATRAAAIRKGET